MTQAKTRRRRQARRPTSGDTTERRQAEETLRESNSEGNKRTLLNQPAVHRPRGQLLTRITVQQSAARLLIIVSVSTFVLQALAMSLVLLMLPHPAWLHVFLASAFLVFLLPPTLYLFLFRPLLLHITERKRAEEALRESEERFRTLSRAALEGILIHEKGKILDANRALATMFGYETSETIGMSVLDFTVPESRGLLLKKIRSQHEEHYEATAVRRDGTTLALEISSRPMSYRGRAARVVAIRDISERKKAEAALHKAREELEDRVERRMQRGNVYGLTFRELTVLHLAAEGKSDKEIGVQLGISPLTARKHVENMLAKMGSSSRTEASVRALREGLLD